MKRLLTVLLALLTTLCLTFGLAACGGNGGGGDRTPSETETPDKDKGGDPSNPEDPYAEYSDILKTVLTDNYYIGLSKEYGSSGFNGSNKQDPIPYKFLKSQGYNMDLYKNDTLSCLCVAYTKEEDTNTLYLSVKAEHEYAGGNYYTNYILSCSLTDKEYADLYMLHQYKYRQASYFIQELDNQKTAKIESAVNVDVQTYNDIKDIYPTYPAIAVDNTKYLDFDFVYVKDATYFEMYVRPSMYYVESFIRTAKMWLFKETTKFSTHSSFDNNILKMENVDRFISVDMDEYRENYTGITYFNSQKIPISGNLLDKIQKAQ